MDGTALVAALQLRLGVPSTDAMFTSATSLSLINAALHMNELDADWPWLEKSETIVPVNGQAEYTPGADWLRTVEVQWGDYPPLDRKDIADLRAMGTPAGRPYCYAVFGDKLVLRAVPNATSPSITHLYIRRQPDLLIGDTPLMPDSSHHAIVELAAYLGFRRVHQMAEAGGAKAAYDEWKQRMLARVDRVSTDQGGGAAPAAAAPAAPASQ